MEENKIKRTWVYLDSPASFEIASCSCGNENTQWSEYQKHLWCDKCEIDFIPEHNGIFDMPIPMNTMKLMGITFSRIDLETQELKVLGENNNYLNAYFFKEFKENMKVKIILTDNDLERPVYYEACMILNEDELKIIEIDNKCPNLNCKVELPIYDENGVINFWNFNVTKNEDGIHFNNEDETNLFCKWLLSQKIIQNLPQKEEKEKPKL